MLPLDCTLAETRYFNSTQIQFFLLLFFKNYPTRGNFVLFIAVPASDAAKAHDKNLDRIPSDLFWINLSFDSQVSPDIS